MRAHGPIFWGAVALGLIACNRVPAESLTMSIPALPDALAQSLPADRAIPGSGQRGMGELCEAACAHWATLRFLEPLGYEQLTPDQKAMAGELLAAQRTLNASECRTECSKKGDRPRAECFLALKTITTSDACLSADLPE